MKTTTCLLFLILTQGLFAQIPSINEHNLIERSYLSSLKNQVETKEKELNFNEKIYLKKYYYYNEEIKKLESEIETKVSEINPTNIDKILREIKQKKNQIEKNQINWKNDSIQLVKGYDVLFPSWTINARDDFFESHYGNTLTKTGFVNSIGLNFNDSGSTMQSELVTDNLGPLRIAFGTVVSTTKTEDSNEETIEASNEEDAYKRLINGGGNFYMETVLPFLTYSQSSITLYSFFNLKGAMDIKSFGNNIDTSTGNVTFGNTTYIGINSDSKKFNFFIQGNLNYSFGSNAFYENLGLNNEKAFVNGKLIFGLTLDQKIRFTAITNTYGSDPKIRSGKLMFGVQFLPDISK